MHRGRKWRGWRRIASRYFVSAQNIMKIPKINSLDFSILYWRGWWNRFLSSNFSGFFLISKFLIFYFIKKKNIYKSFLTRKRLSSVEEKEEKKKKKRTMKIIFVCVCKEKKTKWKKNIKIISTYTHNFITFLCEEAKKNVVISFIQWRK